MAIAFSRRSEADEQRAAIDAVRWRGAELIFPELDASPGAYLICTQAERVRPLAGPGNEFEIDEPYFLERGEP